MEKGLLVRVGIDQTCGKYNAPINPVNGDYFYLPIPENNAFKNGMETSYQQIKSHFDSWVKNNHVEEVIFPSWLIDKNCHLDPDFGCMTYGDQEAGRGHQIESLKKGDFIVFYAGFKSIKDGKLVYAIFGMMTVENLVRVGDLSENQYHQNAHSRLSDVNKRKNDWVVFAQKEKSGRFNRALSIGEYRDGSYRVSKEVLDQWNGLSVKNGYIQRSVYLPSFEDPQSFLSWLNKQNISLISSNW